MKTKSPSGFYLHVPFCESKCSYCDFYSVTSITNEVITRWIRAVTAEARIREFPGVFKTLYFGGGTPSLLSKTALVEVVTKLRGVFDFDNLVETTIEVNPEDVSRDKLRTFKELGFNRISLGAQSFRDEELKFLGRRHDSETSRRALEMIREAGFKSLSLDLIHSLPGQSLSDWEYSLKSAVGFKPDHISCYQLTIKEGTKFGKLLSSGKLKEAGEDIQREMFIRTSEFLCDNGYQHYEVSNFSMGKDNESKHNSLYWEHVPYLGLGPSAHSFDGEKRWWNVSSVEKYCEELEKNRVPVADSEILSGDEFSLESLFLGLRTKKGISLDILKGYDGWEDTSAKLSALSLVEIKDGRMIPTLKGFLMADRLPLLFMD
ncbi:radical SAM family heme chaperone HemW [bacterium]|nr:radical SAM family heme chaperone HemW [bacterium]